MIPIRFSYTIDVGRYRLAIIEQVIADALGVGIYRRAIEELLEEMRN